MKILHAAETIRGGVATVMRLNIAAQTERWGGAQISALAPADQAEDLADKPPCFRLHTFRRTRRDPFSLLRFTVAFIRAVRAERPDIVHLHSSFAGLVGRLCLLLIRPFNRPKVIYCPHGWAFLMDGSATKKRVYASIERFLTPLTNKIICVSDFEKNEARRFGIAAEKMVVIHNGIPVPPEPPARPPHSPADGLRLLFVGRLDHQKGFDVLLEVMRALEGEKFHLTVAGSPVHEAYAPATRENITYAGWVPATAIPDFFAAADVLVMPSRWEAFCLVVIEASVHGLPALVSDCCSLPEQVRHGETGILFPPGDVAELARALRETPFGDWAAMGSAARTYASANFTVDRMAGATMRLYEKTLRG